MKRPDPILTDNGDALSLAAFLLFLALVFATFPNPLPSPRGGEHAGLLGSGPADGTAGQPSGRVPFPKPTSLMVTSWYGHPYHGRPTASGEIYDSQALTAAHRTLPFGTRLRLSVAGRSCIVTINDRGPFCADRDLDVSEAAAERLGMLASGIAIVEARII